MVGIVNVALEHNGSFPVAVDFDCSVEEAIKAGRFGLRNLDINSENFLTKRIGKTDCVIEPLCFNRLMTADEVSRETKKHGFRHAELHELLALAKKYPDLQRKFIIAALGSVWQRLRDSRCMVPYLYGIGHERRGVGLRLRECIWDKFYNFAVVRE